LGKRLAARLKLKDFYVDQLPLELGQRIGHGGIYHGFFWGGF
jgi:hypothetical protein